MTRTMVPKEHAPSVLRDLRADPVFSLQRGINRMFDDLWHGFGRSPELPAVFTGHTFPSLEVRDEEKVIKVTAELPGLDPKEVDLSLKDGILTLRGEKKSETREDDDRGTVSERWYGMFERAVSVGEVDETAVAATFENGILTISLPKAERPKETGRKIPIGTK